jgi:hypothetical protein
MPNSFYSDFINFLPSPHKNECDPYKAILNYFDNRSTNASAESFNPKIKAFRFQFRGVRNIEFFLYRLTQIYA